VDEALDSQGPFIPEDGPVGLLCRHQSFVGSVARVVIDDNDLVWLGTVRVHTLQRVECRFYARADGNNNGGTRSRGGYGSIGHESIPRALAARKKSRAYLSVVGKWLVPQVDKALGGPRFEKAVPQGVCGKRMIEQRLETGLRRPTEGSTRPKGGARAEQDADHARYTRRSQSAGHSHCRPGVAWGSSWCVPSPPRLVDS